MQPLNNPFMLEPYQCESASLTILPCPKAINLFKPVRRTSKITRRVTEAYVYVPGLTLIVLMLGVK